MRWPPVRRCLPLLLLEAALGTNAVTLSRRDSLDPLDPGWGGKDLYYAQDKGLFCQKCPAGTHVAADCTEQNGSSTCMPCEHREYMEYPNNLPWCSSCRMCREDQVEQSPCQPTKNRVCVCRNGTFCPPDHPCEMCQKCQPRCPKGQVVLKPCTPYSDLQCGPATDSGFPYLAIVVPAVILGVIVCAAWCTWKYRCCSPGDGGNSSRTHYAVMSSMFQKLLWYRRVNVGTGDNSFNEHVQNQRPRTATEPGVVVPTETARPKRNLVPVPEKDPIKVLRRSFYTFARKIPKDNWGEFGRSLEDLDDNDVVQKDQDEEAFYQMLNKWLNRGGSTSSVNTLLETLDQLHLSGVANDISSTLEKSGLFQREAS